MQKNKYKEVENNNKFGKKSYQERLVQEREANQQIELWDQEQYELPNDVGDAFKNEQ